VTRPRRRGETVAGVRRDGWGVGPVERPALRASAASRGALLRREASRSVEHGAHRRSGFDRFGRGTSATCGSCAARDTRSRSRASTVRGRVARGWRPASWRPREVRRLGTRVGAVFVSRRLPRSSSGSGGSDRPTLSCADTLGADSSRVGRRDGRRHRAASARDGGARRHDDGARLSAARRRPPRSGDRRHRRVGARRAAWKSLLLSGERRGERLLRARLDQTASSRTSLRRWNAWEARARRGRGGEPRRSRSRTAK